MTWYTWYSALKLPEMQGSLFGASHLQNAVLSGALKTTLVVGAGRSKSVPSQSFTREDLRAFLASDEARRIVEAVTTARAQESPRKPLRKQEKRQATIRRLVEMRQEALEWGVPFETYLTQTGYTPEEIREMANASSRPRDDGDTEESLSCDEGEEEGPDSLGDLRGVVPGL